jgi:hypothetical protein
MPPWMMEQSTYRFADEEEEEPAEDMVPGSERALPPASPSLVRVVVERAESEGLVGEVRAT